jgi:hypothetical protein
MTRQRCSEESLGRHQVTLLAEPEFDCVVDTVGGAVKVHPLAADLDVGFVDMPLAGHATLAILLFLAVPVGYVPMTVLAAIMIVAGISAIDIDEARSIWGVGWLARIAAITTFAACLFYSIAVGVILSFLISLVRIANDATIVEANEAPDGTVTETPAPKWIEGDDQVRVINVYGSLFFAGARTLAEQVPMPRVRGDRSSSCACVGTSPFSGTGMGLSAPAWNFLVAQRAGCLLAGTGRRGLDHRRS